MNLSKVVAGLVFVIGAGGGYVGGLSVNRKIAHAASAPVRKVSGDPISKRFIADSADWSQIDSSDPVQLTANLRADHCPQRTIGAIIRARMNRVFFAKARDFSDPLAKYWTTDMEQNAAKKELVKMAKERDEFLYETLGLERPADLSTGLTPEKQRRVAEALSLYPKPIVGHEEHVDQQPLLADRKARVQYLSQYLTEEELLSYRLNQESGAFMISALIRDIRPSPEEFRKVFEALEFDDLNTHDGWLASDVEEKLKEALGSQRYAEYRDTFLPENRLLSMFARAYHLTDDQIDQIRALRANAPNEQATQAFRDYRNAVSGILDNSTAVQHFFSSYLYYKPPRRTK